MNWAFYLCKMKEARKYCYPYPRPAFTVDAAIFDGQKILLIKRANDPFKGKWALPGGFMDMDETPKEAAIRELEEETGLQIPDLIQFKTYGTLNRDPRHRTISTVYYHQINAKESTKVKGCDDAMEAKWFSNTDLPELAFDHREIIDELVNVLF